LTLTFDLPPEDSFALRFNDRTVLHYLGLLGTVTNILTVSMRIGIYFIQMILIKPTSQEEHFTKR